MKKLVFKVVFPTLCIITILFSCCSFSVFAVDNHLIFNISEPVVDNWTGYIIQPRSTYGNTSNTFDLYFWVFTPLGDYSLSYPVVNYYYGSSTTSLQFSSSASDESYFCSLYYTTSGESSTVVLLDSFILNSTSNFVYDIRLTSRYDTFWRPQFKNVVCAIEDFPSSGYSFDVLWGNDKLIYNELVNANSKLNTLINELNLTNEQLVELYTLLSDILSDTDNISKKINSIYTYLNITLDQDIKQILGWESWLESFDYYLSMLVEYLMGPEEGFTQSPTLPPKQDEYNQIEDELLNNEDASNAQNSIDIQINENAMSYIWDLITQFLQSNGKVFGLFISVLSLGIIALILNR